MSARSHARFSFNMRSTARLLGSILAVAAFTLTFLPATPASAEAPPPISFDLQRAIDQAPAGGTVVLPAGTITVASQIWLRSGITIQGAGVDKTVLYMPSAATPVNLLYGRDITGAVIRDLTLTSPAAAGQVIGIRLTNHANVTIERVKVVNCYYALKSDTSGTNLVVRDLVATGCGQPLYASNLSGGLFERLNLEAINEKLIDVTFHPIYLANNNHDLRFRDVRTVGGSGFALQMDSDAGWTSPSTNITFENVYVSHRWAVIIGSGFDGVTIRNLTAYATDPTKGVIQLASPRNVLVEGFTCEGGVALVGTYPGATPANVTLRNGTYPGTLIQPGATITNLVVEDVYASAQPTTTTTTTLAPTTTTTQAPTTTTSSTVPVWALTTTTTAAPPTTTTQAPTTTTAAPTTTTTASPAKTPPPSTTTTIAPSKKLPSPTTTTTESPAPTLLPDIPVTTEVAAVTMASPQDGATVQGRVTVRVNVASPLDVGTVRFYVDDRLLSQDRRAPYTFNWNTRSISAGDTCLLRGVAYDRLGRPIGETEVEVTVDGSSRAVKAETYPPVEATGTFSDLGTQSTYGPAVEILAAASVISGFPDGSFRPQSSTTRAQFAKMATIALGIADSDMTDTPFVDLGPADENLYPQKYVAALTAIGAVGGTKPTEFSPWRPITRAQMITILVRTLETLDDGAVKATSANALSAVGFISPDHTRAMAVAEANGLLEGIEGYGPSWNPWAPAMRGEVAQVLYNLMTL